MSGTVSRLFAVEREAQIKYEIALKEQYGNDWGQYKYKIADHNIETTNAKKLQLEAFLTWHRAALGK